MTQRPPDRIPGASSQPPGPDPAREQYLEGFWRALVTRDRARRAIERDFAAECARLRETYRGHAGINPPCEDAEHQAWHQATLDETGEHMSKQLTEIRLIIGDTQANEVDHGLSIDHDDGNCEWGRLERAGKTRFRLVIAASQEARDRALYRITSSRDIFWDNAGDSFGTADEHAAAQATGDTLNELAKRLITACGGPEGFSEEFRRWIRY